MRVRGWIVTTAVLALTAAACGGEATPELDATEDDATEELAAEPEEEPAPEPEEEPDGVAAAGQLTVADTDLGEVIVDGDGMTLYLFDPDEAGESTCYEDCALSWPPLEGPVEAGDGVDPGLIGTTERTDGTVQATYAGWPLYHFAGDSSAGDVAGQGVQDVWWVLSPEGERMAESGGSEDDGSSGPAGDY